MKRYQGIAAKGLLAGLMMFGAAATAFAQVEEEVINTESLTDYVHQAIVAQRPGEEVTELRAIYIDGEVTGYRAEYSGGDDIEFTSDGHVVGRNPDPEMSYRQ